LHINSPTYLFMKHLMTILLCCFFINVFAQADESKKDVSKTEAFSSKSGSLIQKEFILIGEIKGCKIQVMTVSDLINNASIKSLRFEYKDKYVSGTKIAVLDSDEVDGLITSIKIMQSKILPTTPSNYTEVSYTSRGGFQTGCYISKGAWSPFVKLEKFDSNSYVLIDTNDLQPLLLLIEQAKAKM